MATCRRSPPLSQRLRNWSCVVTRKVVREPAMTRSAPASALGVTVDSSAAVALGSTLRS